MYSLLKFRNDFEIFKKARLRGETLDFGNTSEGFSQNIELSLSQAMPFEVDDVTKMLLLLTDPPQKNDDVYLPFPHTFIDFVLTKSEAEKLGITMSSDAAIGLLVSKGELYLGATSDPDSVVVGRDLRITTLLSTDDKRMFHTFVENINLGKDYGGLEVLHVRRNDIDPELRKVLHYFVLNFLNYLNNPDVEEVRVVRTQKNVERRQREGKPVLPSEHIRILVHGVVKRYMGYVAGAIKSGTLRAGGWVRGHQRRLRAERYKIKRTIWVMPYIKNDPEGEAMLKHYRLISKSDGG